MRECGKRSFFALPQKENKKLDIALKPCGILTSKQLITVETSIPIKLALIKLPHITRLLPTPQVEMNMNLSEFSKAVAYYRVSTDSIKQEHGIFTNYLFGYAINHP